LNELKDIKGKFTNYRKHPSQLTFVSQTGGIVIHMACWYSKALRYTASRSADLGDTRFVIGFQNT
jgi:hypothetical protein